MSGAALSAGRGMSFAVCLGHNVAGRNPAMRSPYANQKRLHIRLDGKGD